MTQTHAIATGLAHLLPAAQASLDDSGATGLPGDFRFTQRDCEWLRNLASQNTGIVLPDTKRNMIYSRLAKRLRHLGMKSFSQYRTLLESGNQAEFGEFINALTTNLTSFFRESHHFDHLRQDVLPQWLSMNKAGSCLRVWSAGCSTGEEPHTISMVLRDALAALGGGWEYRILATDLDTRVLAAAQAGIYPIENVAGMSKAELSKRFLRGAGTMSGKVLVRPELRSPIEFRQLNLIQDWAMAEPFDIVFCRNVVIYFDKPTQKALFRRFADAMTADSYLYIGHSESLFQTADQFQLVGKTTYRKVGSRTTAGPSRA